MGGKETYIIFVGQPEGNRPLRKISMNREVLKWIIEK
jgi:hypothetical protein